MKSDIDRLDPAKVLRWKEFVKSTFVRAFHAFFLVFFEELKKTSFEMSAPSTAKNTLR